MHTQTTDHLSCHTPKAMQVMRPTTPTASPKTAVDATKRKALDAIASCVGKAKILRYGDKTNAITRPDTVPKRLAIQKGAAHKESEVVDVSERVRPMSTPVNAPAMLIASGRFATNLGAVVDIGAR